MNDLESLMCLNAVSGLGSLRTQSLLAAFGGSAAAVWKADEQALCAVPGIGRQTAYSIMEFERGLFLKEEIPLLKKHRVCIITFFDEAYPQLLREIPDPPIVLYVRGQWDAGMFPGMAIVGSRRASVYGLSVARSFAAECAAAGIVVVSGMARGIDTAAHSGCLRAKGKTAAVLGSGLACIYPRENKKLFDEIAGSGCVISEFPMRTGPSAGNFPRRNRVISGLSGGVIVIEAAARSGALITSRCALEQGRDVFAVPGKIGQDQAVGSNRLIQQGAKLVFSALEAAEEIPAFQERVSERVAPQDLPDVAMSDGECKILSVLADEPVYIDDIIERTQLDHQQVLMILLSGECRGRVKRLPGNYFVKSSL